MFKKPEIIIVNLAGNLIQLSYMYKNVYNIKIFKNSDSFCSSL